MTSLRVLLSSVGSRGDVQPLIALALELRARGHDAKVCVAPNFKEWVESFGLECLSMGPDLKKLTGGTVPKSAPRPSVEQMRQLAVHAVRAQFPVLTQAAQGCDLIVAGGTLQIATRSVAESLGIPYVFAAYCPAVLPSPSHAPPKIGAHYSQSLSPEANLSLWKQEEESWNGRFREALNEGRANLGLDSVDSVLRHVITERPWLAADPSLGPAGTTTDMQVTQTGAWLLLDQRLLPDRVEEFLASGAPPVYFGFGSMRSPEGSGGVLVEAARSLGLRSILSRGWGDLAPIDDESDCLSVDDLPHERLFPRVSAVVHHGGAGTTTAAARAGTGQVVVPHLYDQFYWAHRVRELRIGVAGPARDDSTASSMAAAIREATSLETATRARAFARCIELRGAQVAADRLIREFA